MLTQFNQIKTAVSSLCRCAAVKITYDGRSTVREITPEELNGNVFKMIDRDWMLVTAADGDRINTMTASWGGMGILWNKRVAFVFIRPQRYTYEFTEKSDRMTLTFFGGEKREALKICGTKSGRDCDKIKEAGLAPVKLGEGAYTFEGAEVCIQCRKIYTDVIKPESMTDEGIMKNYPKNDFHKVYVCEIEKITVKDI